MLLLILRLFGLLNHLLELDELPEVKVHFQRLLVAGNIELNFPSPLQLAKPNTYKDKRPLKKGHLFNYKFPLVRLYICESPRLRQHRGQWHRNEMELLQGLVVERSVCISLKSQGTLVKLRVVKKKGANRPIELLMHKQVLSQHIFGKFQEVLLRHLEAERNPVCERERKVDHIKA